MNRILMTASAALALATFAAPAFADEVNVSGEIAVVCNVTAPSDVNTLDLTNAGAQPIGAVNVKCNSYSGFKATVESVNGGKLLSADSPSAYSYAINYGVGPVSLTSPYVVFAAQPGDTLSIAAAASAAGRDYGISIEGISTTDIPYAGVYADTLVFTVDVQ